jgi:hypothetical protein
MSAVKRQRAYSFWESERLSLVRRHACLIHSTHSLEQAPRLMGLMCVTTHCRMALP